MGFSPGAAVAEICCATPKSAGSNRSRSAMPAAGNAARSGAGCQQLYRIQFWARSSPVLKVAGREAGIARLAGVDAWLGADKAGHFAACAAVTWAVWVLLQRASAKAGPGAARGRLLRSRPLRLTLAVAAGLVVGVAKEALDAAGVSARAPEQRARNTC